MTIGSNPTADRRSKLCTKRHILIDKTGIPLYVIISSVSRYDVKLVIDMMDNTVIKRRISSARTKDRRTRKNSIYVLIKHIILNPKNKK
jgi:hypothetical protein